jgi:hypothetical protein
MSGNFIPATESNLVRIVASIRDLYMGRSNAMGEFTLTPASTTTVVTAPNVGTQSRIALTPQTASAAAAVTSVYIAQADVVPGQFTVNHDSDAAEDRIFSYSIQG